MDIHKADEAADVRYHTIREQELDRQLDTMLPAKVYPKDPGIDAVFVYSGPVAGAVLFTGNIKQYRVLWGREPGSQAVRLEAALGMAGKLPDYKAAYCDVLSLNDMSSVVVHLKRKDA